MAYQPYSPELLAEQLKLLKAYQEEHPEMGDGPSDAVPQRSDNGGVQLASVKLASFQRTAQPIAVAYNSEAERLLDVVRGEIGYCRWDDPNEGTKYGRWYADLVNDRQYGYSGVAYCAMFATWGLYQVGASAPGIPGAYCPWIVSAIRSAGRAVRAADAQPGDIVLFDWEGDGVSDHIGIVESNDTYNGILTCIEGNTTGPDGRSGSVNRRTRYYSNVVVCCRPDFAQPEPPKPSHETERPNGHEDGGVAGPVFRLYNPNTGEHLYTQDANEYAVLHDRYGWNQEGTAFTVGAEGDRIYRLRAPETDGPGAHHYAPEQEAAVLWDYGWECEGVAWRSGGDVPVLRLYNQYDGDHFWTKSAREYFNLTKAGWDGEGVAFATLS